MLSNSLQDALNKQINAEVYSAYNYLSMAAYSETQNLQGFAGWMKKQAVEEWEHAMKMFDFVNDRGGRVRLAAIDQPPADFASPLDIFTKTAEHERLVSKAINDLYAMAVQENDYATQTFLHWFINEQVEEEKTADHIVAQLQMIGENKNALFMLDRHLGSRE